MNHEPRTQQTHATVRYLMASQSADGEWQARIRRCPPMNFGKVQTVALAIYAMKNYAPATAQDHVFRWLGLAWGGGSATALRPEAKSLATL